MPNLFAWRELPNEDFVHYRSIVEPMTISHTLLRKKIAFLAAAAISLTLVLGVMAVLLDGMQERTLQARMLNRLTEFREFEDACRAYAKNKLLTPGEEVYPRVHHEEMFATLVARDILQLYYNNQIVHGVYKWAAPNSLDHDRRADDFECRVIAAFNENPKLKQLIGVRTIEGREQRYFARPFVVEPTCLGCHGGPKVPSSSPQDGNGVPHEHNWREGKTVAATIFYSPIDDLRAERASMRWAVLGILAAVAAVLLALSYFLFAKILGHTTELQEARDKAEVATKTKSRFLANMSHEIRTPMTAILGYADLLMDPTISASNRNNYLAVIRRNGQHLLTLINDILDLSKIEAGKLALEMRRCNIVALLADVASVVRPRAVENGLALTVEYRGELPETILTDGARLRQAIVNLAGNAVKFTEHGSIRIVASFLTAWRDAQPAVRIEVIDTGIGICREVIPQLFQPFTQGDASVAQKHGGTGLGLTISSHMAQILGGELTVTSVWGQGSTFSLTVPTGSLKGIAMLHQPAEVEQTTAEQTAKSTGPDLQDVRVLLAEDGVDNQRLIEAILKKAGAEVETVENGRLALVKAENEPFDLILMDMNMPEMDGYEAARTLRDHGYAKPILALTANAMSDDSQRCLAAGCNEYMAKPIDRTQLIQMIATHVGKHTAAGEAMPRRTEISPTREDGSIVSRFADDPEIAEILGGFVKRLAAQVEAMRTGYESGRHDDLRRLAHRLKGAGGSYGYPSLTEACGALEEATRSSDQRAEAAALDAVAAISKGIQQGYAELAGMERTPQ